MASAFLPPKIVSLPLPPINAMPRVLAAEASIVEFPVVPATSRSLGCSRQQHYQLTLEALVMEAAVARRRPSYHHHVYRYPGAHLNSREVIVLVIFNFPEITAVTAVLFVIVIESSTSLPEMNQTGCRTEEDLYKCLQRKAQKLHQSLHLGDESIPTPPSIE